MAAAPPAAGGGQGAARRDPPGGNTCPAAAAASPAEPAAAPAQELRAGGGMSEDYGGAVRRLQLGSTRPPPPPQQRGRSAPCRRPPLLREGGSGFASGRSDFQIGITGYPSPPDGMVWVGRLLNDHLCSSPPLWAKDTLNYIKMVKATSSLAPRVSRDGAPIASPGSCSSASAPAE